MNKALVFPMRPKPKKPLKPLLLVTLVLPLNSRGLCSFRT